MVTRAQLEAGFAQAGLSSDDARARASLVIRAAEGCRVSFGGPPHWCWFVPGRLEIFGKHTDYAGGRSLLATVPRGLAVAARPRSDSAVHVVDLVDRQGVHVNPLEEVSGRHGLFNYVQVVARRFALNFDGAALGVDIAIAGDLPRAAGLSSSSALVIGIASALIRRAGLPDRDDWRRHIGSVHDLASYLGCIENGYDFGALRGSSGVGTLGGTEDHTAILACRAGQVSQFRFVPVQHLDEAPMPADWAFVVACSGIQADKAGAARDDYNRAARSARALLDIWNAHARHAASSLGDALAQEPESARRLEHWIAPAPEGFAPGALRRRLLHFIGEDQRVADAARAFQAADADELGRLADASQRDAQSLLGNQIAETRALSALARHQGAWAASSFGAGFGGSVWALVPRADAARFGESWVTAYRKHAPSVSGVEYFVARPGPPLVELPAIG